MALELRDESRLAHAGWTDDGHEGGPAIGLDSPEGLLEDGQLLVTADEARLHPQARPLAPGPGLDAQRAPGRHWFGLALEDKRVERLVFDDSPGARVDRWPYHDLARFGCRLQARGGVDGVAGQHAISRPAGTFDVDQDLARLHADAHRQRRLAFGREAAVQLGEDGLHLEANPNRPFRVVLVGLRNAEHGQDRIAHEFLEESFVAADLHRQPVEGAANDRLHDLGILVLGEGG